MPAETDILAAENRRLLRELKAIRARAEALESSRWWRLHPRSLLRRRGLVSAPPSVAPVTTAIAAETETAPLAGEGELIRRFRDDVISRGSFRSDMVSGNFEVWEQFLEGFVGRSARVLEIGSFEGMSACYFLWRLPDARVTCIDTFAGGPSFEALGADVAGLEAAFDRNVALVDASRVRKLVGESARHLLELVGAGEQFEVVFVDGSDLALDVLVDAALSWQMLAPGGYLIFDNYGWRSPLGEDPLFHPAPAVDAFADLVKNHTDVVLKRNQFILRRAEAEPA